MRLDHHGLLKSLILLLSVFIWLFRILQRLRLPLVGRIIYLIILARYQVVINITCVLTSLRLKNFGAGRMIFLVARGHILNFTWRSSIETVIIGSLMLNLIYCAHRSLSKVSGTLNILLIFNVFIIKLLITVFVSANLVSFILWRFFLIKIWHFK